MITADVDKRDDCRKRPFAIRKFNPVRSMEPKDWADLEDALLLIPSSFELQPWRFVVVTDRVTKKYLAFASWEQQQMVDDSYVFVLARKNLNTQDLDTCLDHPMLRSRKSSFTRSMFSWRSSQVSRRRLKTGRQARCGN